MIREELDVCRVLRIVTETLDALVDGRLVHRVSVQVEQQRLNRRVHTLSQHTPERKMSRHSIPQVRSGICGTCRLLNVMVPSNLCTAARTAIEAASKADSATCSCSSLCVRVEPAHNSSATEELSLSLSLSLSLTSRPIPQLNPIAESRQAADGVQLHLFDLVVEHIDQEVDGSLGKQARLAAELAHALDGRHSDLHHLILEAVHEGTGGATIEQIDIELRQIKVAGGRRGVGLGARQLQPTGAKHLLAERLHQDGGRHGVESTEQLARGSSYGP